MSLTYGPRLRSLVLLAAAVLLPAACLSEDPRPGTDGPPRDTGGPLPPDGGGDPTPDAAPPPDAAPMPDAGGQPDGPSPDGPPPGQEAGSDPDVTPDLRPDVTPIGPLLAHWPLDEGMGAVAADVSPNGNGGTVMGGATWTTMGLPGAMFPNPAALVLDGVDDFVELNLRTMPPPEAVKSISLWFWIEAPAGAGRKNLIALTNLGEGAGIQLGLDAGRASAWLMGEMTPLIATMTPVAAGWHHLAYTFDGTTHTLYLDNTSVGTVMRAPKPGEVLLARLGAYDFLDEMFGGRIDDVRIYDRALDAAAVAALAGGRTP